jgi:hypothetical protein
MASHAQLPIPDSVDESRVRIFFGARDIQNRSRAAFLEAAASDPRHVLSVHDRPVLDVGEIGCFDDSGVIPSWMVTHGGLKWLYYVGVSVGVTTPYHYAIGLAVSSDGGCTFQRAYRGPVVERTALEPYLCTSPCVLVEGGCWKMWYACGIEWELVEGKPEPVYHIRYTESDDGVNWRRPGRISIDFASAEEGGIGRPSVLAGADGRYRMWFSYRGRRGYRTDTSQTYRIGYAESEDGLSWTRRDDLAGIDVGGDGWDSEMVAYPYVYRHAGSLKLLYNGNGFGRSGFGYASAEEPEHG